MKERFLFVLLVPFYYSFSQTHSIQMDKSSFAELKERSKKENKMIMLDFSTVWCAPCKKMEKEVFTNDTVANFFNAHFICSIIDPERGEGSSLAATYTVQAYPTFIFLSSDGETVHRALGFRDVKDFVKLGSDAMDPAKQLSAKRKLYAQGRRDPNFISGLLDDLEMNQMTTEKQDILNNYLKEKKDSELLDTVHWKILKHVADFIPLEVPFSCLESRGFRFFIDNYRELIRLHGDTSVNERISDMLGNETSRMALDTTKSFEHKLPELKTTLVKNFPNINKLFLDEIDLSFYLFSQDWEKYSDLAVSGIVERLYWRSDWKLDRMAGVFSNQISDKEKLQRAAGWSRRSIELQKKSFFYYNTYAHILFKLGEKDKAVEMENKAIDLTEAEYFKKQFREALSKFEK